MNCQNALIPIAFFCYQIIFIAISPLIILYYLICLVTRRIDYQSFKELLGFTPPSQGNKHTIWIHASSVGEVLSIQSFVRHLKQHDPIAFCYITTSTLTGKKMAQKFMIGDMVSMRPLDILACIMIARKRIAPSQIIIVEADLWPALLFTTRRIKKYLLSARIREKSHKKYRSLARWYRILFHHFEHLFVQYTRDYQEFLALGIPAKKLSIIGDIKIANVVEKQKTVNKEEITHTFKERIFVVGSVHPEELDHYLSLFDHLKKKDIPIKMILAPRHFHWKKILEKRLQTLEYTYTILTNPSLDINAILEHLRHTDILALYVLGKLFELYSHADLCFLGGTFIPIGGHSIIEPTLWGKCTIVGPYHHNCKPLIDELALIGSVIKVSTKKGLRDTVEKLIETSSYRHDGILGRRLVLDKADSVKSHIERSVQVISSQR